MLSQAVANIKVMYILLLMLFVDKFVKLVGKSVDFSKKIFSALRASTHFSRPKKGILPLGFSLRENPFGSRKIFGQGIMIK